MVLAAKFSWLPIAAYSYHLQAGHMLSHGLLWDRKLSNVLKTRHVQLSE
jgi:hypothetical protein